MPSASFLKAALAGAFSLFAALPAFGDEYVVTSAETFDDALAEAMDGDVIRVRAGTYRCQPVVTAGIAVIGESGAVIDAGGKGSGITVRWPGARIENLTVINYGGSLYDRDAGVRLTDGADGVVLRNLRLKGPGYGIRGDRLAGLRIEDCEIEGDAKRHVLDRGDGVALYYVKAPVLTGNKVRNVRDGFYFENVEKSRSDRNFFTGAQYGIHWMYTRGDGAAHNRAAGVRGGYALMSSKDITLTESLSEKNIEFGILLNVCDGCTVLRNRVLGVHNPKGNPALDNEGKGLFIYGPGVNTVAENRFELSDIGIAVAMGGEGTRISRNSFVDNRIQVRYVGERSLEWSEKGVGNYWSEYLGWDVNHDGIGDRAFQPNDSLDRLFWIYPEARFLMDSPVVALLRWLAAQFEIDRGKGVTDSAPLMRAPVFSDHPLELRQAP